MKFLIAGLGSIGRRHLRNLKTLGEEDIILYRTHRSTMPDDELAGLPVETSFDLALAHNPDAIIVSNPTALHLDMAIPAAQAGCHLYIDKPISHSMERMDELNLAVAQNNLKVLIGYQFRFHPGLIKISQLLNEKVIGRPVSVKGEVEYIWAFAGQLSDLELEVEDTADIGLRFNHILLGSVHLDYVQRPPSHRLEIIGTQGTIRWDNTDGLVQVRRVYMNKLSEDWESYPVPDGFDRNDMFLDLMHHFIAVIKGESEPVCDLQDGIKSLQLALSAVESARQGKLVAP
jgi:predicted dehydrogenase